MWILPLLFTITLVGIPDLLDLAGFTSERMSDKSYRTQIKNTHAKSRSWIPLEGGIQKAESRRTQRGI
jgi:hypothetical protein